ncbi:OLC1v1014863C2 [Oldenlandia corymbosa var. corymbosa]|nr:OLC1v1014863C2 [Oldenlandia corymbosa var. corymbosa]
MAPHGEAIGMNGSPFNPVKNFMVINNNNIINSKPRRLSNDGLKRTTSDISYELSNLNQQEEEVIASLPAIPEVEDAKCECCGMIEEYTLEYIGKVREKYGGRWICGLCAEAVKEETAKNGGKRSPQDALEAHMNACFRFNKFGRAYPVLSQAQAMREIFRKSVSLDSRAGLRGNKSGGMPKKGQISRSSSCIPAITREFNEFKLDSN